MMQSHIPVNDNGPAGGHERRLETAIAFAMVAAVRARQCDASDPAEREVLDRMARQYESAAKQHASRLDWLLRHADRGAA